MKSSKRGTEKNRSLSDHMLTLHQRLYHALNLGIKCHDNKGKKWQCTDIEMQRLAIRSISTFVGYLSQDMSQHPLVKNSVADMLVALEGILQSRNEAVLGMATTVAVKLTNFLGNSILLYHVSELVHSLSCLLSFHQSSIAVSCAVALNQILSKLSQRRLKSYHEVWEILKERNAVDIIICCLQDFINGIKPIEYFQEMASLLKTILWRWPSSRYSVWSNAKLVEGLGTICVKPDSSVGVSVLQLYSALALCGTGATKLLENEENFLPMILHCMDSSQPNSVRLEAFKLLQLLVRSEQGFLILMRRCCTPIVKAIINAMGGWSSCSGKFSTDQVPLLVEACRLALITRWAGDHHNYIWKLGVDRVLLDLLLDNFHKTKQSQALLSFKEMIATAREGLDANYLVVLRPYVWDILGWLATHCGEDFNPDMYGNKQCLNLLIVSACLILMDSIQKGRQVYQNDASYTSKLEPASRAVLLMINSPCKIIASRARNILSEVLMPNMEEYLEYLLDTLKSTTIGNNFGVVDNLQTVMNLMGLACFFGLPKYQRFIMESDGVKILSTFIGWCLSNHFLIRRSSIAPHLHDTSYENTCCWLDMEDWEGRDILLFYSLWGLAELIQHSSSVRNNREAISCQVVGGVELGGSDAQILVDRLHEICRGTYSPGTRWYAAHILRNFGFYGFQSRLGKRFGKALYEEEYADVQLKLSSGESVSVHSVVLSVRCLSLLPYGEFSSNEKMSEGSVAGQNIEQFGRKFRREVCLSARVDHQTLMKILEFVYMGFIEVGHDLVKQLKMLARHCNFHCLSILLGRKRPKWGAAIPCFDFTPALGPAGYHFSDVILEPEVSKVTHWTCNVCSQPMPHIHAHKIILWLSCDYMRALFQSGMQESHSQTIKVPVGWEALTKLVSWFYLDELPKPISGCTWNNMDIELQLQEVNPYVELCWLAEFWFLEDIREDTLRVVVSCLNYSRHLQVKIIQIAANLSQWEIVEVAANLLAPSYPHLRDSGDLEALNEEIVDMVRVAYVRLSQAG